MRILPFNMKSPRLDQEVTMKTIEISSIPAGANPFHHDSGSMGVEVRQGLMVMSSYQGPAYWPDLYIVNPVTGQRFVQAVIPVVPEFDKVISLSTGTLTHGIAYFDNVEYAAIPELTYVSMGEKPNPETVVEIINSIGAQIVRTTAGSFKTPPYVIHRDHAVLLSVVQSTTQDELHQIIADEAYMAKDDVSIDVVREIRALAGMHS